MAYTPPNINGQTTSANSAPVVIANDQSTISTRLTTGLTATTGSITSATSTVTLTSLVGVGSITVSVYGTYAGVNASFLGYDGTNWVAVPAILATTVGATPTTTTGSQTNATLTYTVSPVLGYTQFRYAASAWTSGTQSVIIIPSAQFVPIQQYVTGSVSVSTAPTTTVAQATAASLNATVVQATATNLNAQVVGSVASGATDAGNPVKVGGLAKTTNPTSVTDAQRVNALFDKSGRAIVSGSIPELRGRQSTTLASTTTETTIITAGAAGVFNHVYSLILANTSTTATLVTIRDVTAAGTPMYFVVPASGTAGFTVPAGDATKQGTAASAWTAQCATSVSSVYVTALYVASV